MTWTANGGAPPDIVFEISRNPTHSFPKVSIKFVTLYSIPRIIGWGYMDSFRGAILDNNFLLSLENFQCNMKGGGGTNNFGTKALNLFDEKMGNINEIDNVQASKYGW